MNRPLIPVCAAALLAMLWLLIASLSLPLAAQPADPTPSAVPVPHPRHVFIERGQADAPDALLFLDLITGESTRVPVTGERYTLLTDGVLFYDPARQRMRVALPDGRVRDHSVMQPPENARRIDWVTSADRHRLAWTITEGDPSALTTTTYVLALEGEGELSARQVLADGPRDGIRAYPVAFDVAGERLYMDYQPDTIAGLLPLDLYAALFSIDLTSGVSRSLPGEPGCFCGAVIGGGQFVRLALADAGGFSVRIIDVEALSQRIAPPVTLSQPDLAAFAQAGDVRLSPDGGQAIYTLMRVYAAADPDRAMESALILVDLADLTQRVVLPPTFDRIRVIDWTADASGLLIAVQPATADTGGITVLLDAVSGATRQAAPLELLGILPG